MTEDIIVEDFDNKILINVGGCHVGTVSAHSCVPSANGGKINQTFEVIYYINYFTESNLTINFFQIMMRSLDNLNSVECSTVIIESHQSCNCGCGEETKKCTNKQVNLLLFNFTN